MYDFIESYGYPKYIIGSCYYKQTLGWFLPNENKDEPAYYFDIYFYNENCIDLIIDGFYKNEEISLVEG